MYSDIRGSRRGNTKSRGWQPRAPRFPNPYFPPWPGHQMPPGMSPYWDYQRACMQASAMMGTPNNFPDISPKPATVTTTVASKENTTVTSIDTPVSPMATIAPTTEGTSIPSQPSKMDTSAAPTIDLYASQSDVDRFACHQCGKTFSKKFNLNRHCVRAHQAKAQPRNPGKARYVCHWCQKSFAKRKTVSLHKRGCTKAPAFKSKDTEEPGKHDHSNSDTRQVLLSDQEEPKQDNSIDKNNNEKELSDNTDIETVEIKSSIQHDKDVLLSDQEEPKQNNSIDKNNNEKEISDNTDIRTVEITSPLQHDKDDKVAPNNLMELIELLYTQAQRPDVRDTLSNILI